MMRSALYVGHVVHARNDAHARRAFRYPVYTACLALDELPELARRLRLFSYNRPNLFSIYDRDYTTPLASLETSRVVTQLRVAHYVFNPVSFFLRYDAGGALASAVAEVNNNYGGRHAYALGPEAQTAPGRYRVEKRFFVSPFLHGPATYDFHFDAPLDGDELCIGMRVRRPDDGATFFVARIEGRRVPLTDRALAWAALRYPLMTLQVIGLIYWEALRMHLAGVPFRRPGSDHAPTPLDPPPRAARTSEAHR
jgi:DUF1365 family protein